MAQSAYEANAKLYHDMGNHLTVLQTYLFGGKYQEAEQYIQALCGSRAVENIERWTGMEAIDYILSQKITEAKKQKIGVDIRAEYPKDCKIDPVDLCTILTNLFDNAVEGWIYVNTLDIKS